ncbi:MAG: ribonucleotide-diphosphate reductase subunit beta [Puniceicoccales bacterium]|jgi:ribonucleoside-diphosphate reductase beta chain|nr:ribonucleotide-diphosphate reductase subunit beta [Puniceicoccales bacterium]
MNRRYETFSTTPNNQLQEPIFLGQSVNVARYDQQKYPIFEKLIDKQLSFFWRPEEIDVSIDGIQYETLAPHEKHIFLSNLKYQTLMDSIQGRSPNILFLPIVSLPEVETWIATWSFSETIHSRSYTHIIRAIERHPDVVFNNIVINPEIRKRAASISFYYNQLHRYNILADARSKGMQVSYDVKEHMKMIVLAIHAVNALESIRFYVSFACSFAFAERGLMEGNAKIIKLIARDEILHWAGTRKLIALLSDGSEGQDWKNVCQSCHVECEQLFLDAVAQEIEWTKYLFKDGSILGLNEKILKDYIFYLAHTRMESLHMKPRFNVKSNPIPWIDTWFNSDHVQVAPQEVELSSYLTNQINATVDPSDLNNIEI